jgi:hypothetical protein
VKKCRGYSDKSIFGSVSPERLLSFLGYAVTLLGVLPGKRDGAAEPLPGVQIKVGDVTFSVESTTGLDSVRIVADGEEPLEASMREVAEKMGKDWTPLDDTTPEEVEVVPIHEVFLHSKTTPIETESADPVGLARLFELWESMNILSVTKQFSVADVALFACGMTGQFDAHEAVAVGEIERTKFDRTTGHRILDVLCEALAAIGEAVWEEAAMKASEHYNVQCGAYKSPAAAGHRLAMALLEADAVSGGGTAFRASGTTPVEVDIEVQSSGDEEEGNAAREAAPAPAARSRTIPRATYDGARPYTPVSFAQHDPDADFEAAGSDVAESGAAGLFIPQTDVTAAGWLASESGGVRGRASVVGPRCRREYEGDCSISAERASSTFPWK